MSDKGRRNKMGRESSHPQCQCDTWERRGGTKRWGGSLRRAAQTLQPGHWGVPDQKLPTGGVPCCSSSSAMCRHRAGASRVKHGPAGKVEANPQKVADGAACELATCREGQRRGQRDGRTPRPREELEQRHKGVTYRASSVNHK